MKHKKLQENRSIKYNTTRRAIQLLQIVKGLWAGLFCLAGRIRPVGRWLLTAALIECEFRISRHIQKSADLETVQEKLTT